MTPSAAGVTSPLVLVMAKPLTTAPSASAVRLNTEPAEVFTTAHSEALPQLVGVSDVAGELADFGPRIVKGLLTFTFSVYVPALTRIVSPAVAAVTAAWIVE